jgi:hypothetical protein
MASQGSQCPTRRPARRHHSAFPAKVRATTRTGWSPDVRLLLPFCQTRHSEIVAVSNRERSQALQGFWNHGFERSRCPSEEGVAPGSAPRLSADKTRTFRSQPTSPVRGSFKPVPPLAPSNLLISQASNIRTKTAVVRLRQRKWPDRKGKRPEMGLSAGPRGSER